MRIEGTPKYYSNSTKMALGIGALLGIFFAIYIGAIAIFAAGTLTYANLFSGSILDESLTSGEPYSYDDNSLTPLMEAVLDYDEVKVQELVSDGESLEDQDSEKTTALLLSIYNDNDSIAQILLEAGANPNTADNFSNALTVSLYNENYKLAKLLYSYGADPSIEDPEGFSAFSILDVDNENDFLASLKNF